MEFLPYEHGQELVPHSRPAVSIIARAVRQTLQNVLHEHGHEQIDVSALRFFATEHEGRNIVWVDYHGRRILLDLSQGFFRIQEKPPRTVYGKKKDGKKKQK